MLELIKKGDKYWNFIDTEIGNFSASKFTINTLSNTINIVYFNNLKSKEYNVSDCYIFDIGDTIGFNTSNIDDFMSKLEELNCPCFQKDQTTIINPPIDISGKLDKDTTAGVERAYIINADGSQSTKATSDFKDVLEFANLASFPLTGETGKIYLALDTNFTYRWSGSAYVQIGGSAKKSQSLLFQVPTNGTTLDNTQKIFCQSRFNGQSVFGSLGLVFGSGIAEISGVINLSDFSDKATPEITPNYISQVKHIKMSYSRNVAESGANTNVVVYVMADSKYLVNMQLIAKYNLTSSSVAGTGENKVDIPVLPHLDLSAYSNIKWCIRTNNATAQTFNFIRLNVDIEEV